MRATVTTTVGPATRNPFVDNPALGGGGVVGSNSLWNRFRDILKAVATGGIPDRNQQRPKLYYSTANATGTVTFASVQVGDTVTVNGQALTATQARASGTVTAASAIAGNTVTVNGHLFTAVAGAPAANQFSIDTGDTETATSLAAAIQAAAAIKTNTLLYGLIGAKSASAVVTVFALSAGTAGNAYTLASSGATLAVSGATLANGAAAAANQFDFIGTDAVNAGSLSDALAASTTALVSGQVVGTNRTAIVTCSSVAAGDTVTVLGQVLQAGVTATDSGGARITTMPPNLWCQASTDTNDAVSLVNCINAHPVLRELVFASNSSGVVTIRERSPSLGAKAVVTSSNGTRLAVTNVSTTGEMQPSAVCFVQCIHAGTPGNATTLASSNGSRLAVSAARLTGGAMTALTY